MTTTHRGALLGLLILNSGFLPVRAAPANLTAGDYSRAERFLVWNASRYVLNGDIQHHWIGHRDQFWYMRANSAGEQERVIVDAVTGRQSVSTERQDAPAAPAAGEIPSPDHKWSAFLKDRNLWLRSAAGGPEFALTSDGVEHYAYAAGPGYSTHSVSDLRQSTPIPPQVIWSPDSRFLFTFRLDERRVKELFLVQSTPEDGSTRPKLYNYRYAVPGDTELPMIEPVVFDVAARRRINLAVPPLVSLAFTLVEKRDAWWSADSRTLYFLNRDRFSKTISLNEADPFTGAVRKVLEESSKTLVYTNANTALDFPTVKTLSNGDVIWYSQRDGWGHLYYYDGRTGALRKQITKGQWIVRGIVRVDEAQRKIYFTASGREHGRDPYERRLYGARLDGSGLQLLTPEEADHELHAPSLLVPRNPANEIEAVELSAFSPSGRYFVDSYSRPDMPAVMVLRASNGKLIKRLEQADITKLKADGHVPIEPFEALAADGKTRIFGNLFRPSNFDAAKKYPVIDAVYPGPQIIRARKSFIAATFDEYEAQSLAELGFIVVTVDGRGTPLRSRELLEYSYGHLDKASDLEDHIAGIRQLASRYSFMDLERVGIDGVSGGGFAAAHAVLTHPDFYKVAVAAEGNHDVRDYVASWAETYNGPIGQGDYESYANPPLAGNLQGKLLLAHGEMDDNVHPAHTLKLVDALIKANKDFDLLIIPNQNHAMFINSPYFIRRKWDYFVRNLLGAQPPANYSIALPAL